jgi:hypothetical protein
MPVYEAIRQFVLKHTVIGADETGVNINGKNHWAWAFQNQRATYIAVHKSRGSAAIKEIMPEGFDRNILVTDCWAAYFKAGALSHQLCTAHLRPGYTNKHLWTFSTQLGTECFAFRCC